MNSASALRRPLVGLPFFGGLVKNWFPVVSTVRNPGSITGAFISSSNGDSPVLPK
jgi:hypothetical protein